jgi:release factor glutamine methyltransferase
VTAVGQWLRQTDDIPRIECELLLNQVLGLSRAQILTHPETPIPSNAQQQLHQFVEQLRSGTPLAYITGSREFWGIDFHVTPDVLIPRPETELLVELSVALAPADGTLIDLGTGSGAIAIAIKAERPDLTITATDASGDALSVAQLNAERVGVEMHWRVQHWLADDHNRWDMIVSNPPYIAKDDPHLPGLSAEPRQALVAGPDGLDDIRQIVASAPGHLQKNGYVLIEHGYDQADQVQQLMSAAGLSGIESKKDLAGISRVTLGQYAGR